MSILIKKFVRMVLESADRNVDQTDDKNPEEKEKPDNLLLEPDEPDDPEDTTDEASVVANIAGVTTPLGTGPTHPRERRKKKPSKRSSAWYMPHKNNK